MKNKECYTINLDLSDVGLDYDEEVDICGVYQEGEPATWLDPGTPESFEVMTIESNGVNLLDMFDDAAFDWDYIEETILDRRR